MYVRLAPQNPLLPFRSSFMFTIQASRKPVDTRNKYPRGRPRTQQRDLRAMRPTDHQKSLRDSHFQDLGEALSNVRGSNPLHNLVWPQDRTILTYSPKRFLSASSGGR